MKVLLIFSWLFFYFFNISAQAQTSPYLDSQAKTKSTPKVEIIPLSNEKTQPRGFFMNKEPAEANLQSGKYVDKIRQRGKVRCGTNLQLKSYAYYEDGDWHGIDADVCKALALAIIGNDKQIEMINITAGELVNALNTEKVDVMLSGVPFFAGLETSDQINIATVLYYEPQLLMVAEGMSKNIADYKGQKICIATGSDYYRNFDAFNAAKHLDSKYLSYADMTKVKEAFLLKRCQMVTGGALFLNGMKKALSKGKPTILPISIAISPVYALVSGNNAEFGKTTRWIINGLLLAEQYDINRRNLSFYTEHHNQEVRNLMGDEPQMWQNMGLRAKWISDAINSIGNYGDIYERNIGKDSDFKLPRNRNKLLKNGGILYPQPFM